MNSGMVDVRTRAGGRLGKKRVDEFADMVAKEKMTTASAFTKFYEKAWDPADYGASGA